MKIKILGCNGGIGNNQLFTTSFLIDDDILIDAGTGVSRLTIDQMKKINHIFITHSHLDHICSIPFLIDIVSHTRKTPLRIYALLETIEALKQHIFNWVIWPDFSSLPNHQSPALCFENCKVGQEISIGNRMIIVLPANHIVPAVGYAITCEQSSFAFSGDTGRNDAFWPIINQLPNLKILIIETAFCNHEADLANISKHLYPALLAEQLKKLEAEPAIYITHLKPADAATTMAEIMQTLVYPKLYMLSNKDEFKI